MEYVESFELTFNVHFSDFLQITTFAEAAEAVQTGYGFDYPLAVFLSALGLLAGGDLVTGKYSIGGADSRVPNTLGPALGLGKHGVFEIDGSITRQDVNFGNNANFLLQRWDEYVEISKQYGGQFGRETNAIDNVSYHAVKMRYILEKMLIRRDRAYAMIILERQTPISLLGQFGSPSLMPSAYSFTRA